MSWLLKRFDLSREQHYDLMGLKTIIPTLLLKMAVALDIVELISPKTMIHFDEKGKQSIYLY